jgi:hypothetical protein
VRDQTCCDEEGGLACFVAGIDFGSLAEQKLDHPCAILGADSHVQYAVPARGAGVDVGAG